MAGQREKAMEAQGLRCFGCAPSRSLMEAGSLEGANQIATNYLVVQRDGARPGLFEGLRGAMTLCNSEPVRHVSWVSTETPDVWGRKYQWDPEQGL